MVDESIALGLSRSKFDRSIAEAGFVLLLLLAFIGTTPLDDRNVSALSARNAASVAGDLTRQVAFLSTFALIVFAALRRHGLAIVKAFPLSLTLMMGWCLLSASWAAEPAIVMRRSVLGTIFVSSILLSVETLGATRAILLWRNLVMAVILADLASVALFQNAIHLPSDVESNLAGAWRGLHAHKNTAGAFAATSAIMFFYFAVQTKKSRDVFLCVLSALFLVMTRSKSSLGLLPVALIGAGLYRASARNRLNRAIAVTFIALSLMVLTIALALNWEFMERLLEDPQNLTGRAAIWQAEFAYIRDHFLLGAGFGTFGNTDMRSPLYFYVGSGWVSQIGEGHSGYLEMLVTLGVVGFILGMTALVIVPVAQFWKSGKRSSGLNAILFGVFLFDILHNFMESDFIQVTSVQWGQLLLVLALLRISTREAEQGAPVLL